MCLGGWPADEEYSRGQSLIEGLKKSTSCIKNLIQIKNKIRIWKKVKMCTKEDPIEFLIELDKLDSVQKYLKFIVCKVNWDDYLYSKLPTSTVPKTVNNAEIINTILAKSWEIQGGDDTKGHLMTNSCYVVNTLLMYYFKSLNIAHNMKRVVGSFESPRGPRPIVHSFLKFGDHVICNTFVKAEMEAWKNNSYMMFQYGLACKYNDVDPADPKYGVDPNSSDIGKY